MIIVGFSASCQTSKKSIPQVPSALYQYWISSHEEDAGGVKVFRPKGYNFPPSRGRVGLNLHSDGTYIEYKIGPNDAPVAIPGKFTVYEDGKTVVLTPNDGTKKGSTFGLVELTKELLKIK